MRSPSKACCRVRDAAASFLLGRQQSDGSFGSVLETATAYRSLLLAGVSVAELPFGSPVPYLLGRQQANGSWEEDAFTSAEVVLALQLQRPNLVLATIDAPASSAAGLPIIVTVTVKNSGPEPAAPSQLEIRYEADGELAAAAPVAALAPGEEVEVALEVDTTGFTEALDAGFTLLLNARNLGETEVASFVYRVTRRVGGVPDSTVETLGPWDYARVWSQPED